MHLLSLLLLGLVYSSTARKCLHPSQVENFDFEKYKGTWYEVGYHTHNSSMADEYKGSKCVKSDYKVNGHEFDLTVDYVEDGKNEVEKGKYILQENEKSIFSINFPDEPSYNVFSYHIVCTDYSSYGVAYTCVEFEEDKSADFIIINARDRTKYNDILSNEDVKKCLQDQLDEKPDRIDQVPQNDC